MSGTETLLVISLLASGTAAVVQTRSANRSARLNEQIYAAEAEASKIRAIDESTQRLRRLRFVTEQRLNQKAGAGVLPFASGSFLALQQFDTKIADEDLRSIRLNLGSRLAGYSARSQASKDGRRSNNLALGLDLVALGAKGAQQYSLLKKPPLDADSAIIASSTPPTLPKPGSIKP